MSAIGQSDTHNFGRFVSRQGDWIQKPRPIFWEWLFLCNESPIRRLFSSEELSSSSLNPFEFFPLLKFRFEADSLFKQAGFVEFFASSIDSVLGKPNLSQAIGRGLGVVLYFGMNDLHYENMAAGDWNEKTCFFPIDIESAFLPTKILSQSYIVRSIKNSDSIVGTKYFHLKNINVSEIVDSFTKAVFELNHSTENIRNSLHALDAKRVPIRILLRDTYEYYEYLDGKEMNNIIPEELVQLDRSDIPYFFSYVGDENIYFFNNSGIEKVYQINENMKKVILFPNNNFVESVPDESVKQSILQIARSFDSGQEGALRYGEVETQYKGGEIFLSVAGRWKVKCKRLKN